MFYEPFGQPRDTCRALTGNVAYTFTDQEWDAETGLYNYDARLYDAMMGRFLSADSVIPDYYNPQALDRYAYVLNNPLGWLIRPGMITHHGKTAIFSILTMRDPVNSMSWRHATSPQVRASCAGLSIMVFSHHAIILSPAQ